MLSKLALAGFRACVDATSLTLGPLTVLAGANNTGKSSFVGALLSLVQSHQTASRHRLLLSGDWVDLGPFDELLSPDRQTFSIGIEGSIESEALSVVWDFAEDRRSRPEARVTRIEAVVGENVFDSVVDASGTLVADPSATLLHPGAVLRAGAPEVRFLPYAVDQVLSVGPYRAPPTALSPFRVGTDGSLVGQYGQYAAEAFWQHRDKTTDVLPPDGARTDTVASAMDRWWSYVLGDEINVNVEEVARLGFSVKLDTSGIANRSFGQVGFGLSQLWPILVAGLASQPGDLVIVETPEAHLHPGAQHRVAMLFVELARRGRQVIVETHSEHVVAAACLAVKRRELAPDKLALSFFSQAKGHTQIERIDVDPSGRRLSAPEGFFDQSSQELLDLLAP